MKIIVFSDSHGCTDNMCSVMKRNFSDTDLVIHLGDGSEDCAEVMADYPQIPLVLISGNREEYLHLFLSSPLMIEDVFTVAGKKIVAGHGHKYHVKSGDTGAISHALSLDADILLYGHTHEAVCKTFVSDDTGHELYILNPGTVGATAQPTYGMLLLSDDGIKAEIKSV